MKIAVSADERIYLVDVVLDELRKRGHAVAYFGPEPGQEADWPLVTLHAVEQVASGQADEGIVMCWTGTGATIVANKVPGIRAACQFQRKSRKERHSNVTQENVFLRELPAP
jgi:ribose 5-phosphate isomerase B